MATTLNPPTCDFFVDNRSYEERVSSLTYGAGRCARKLIAIVTVRRFYGEEVNDQGYARDISWIRRPDGLMMARVSYPPSVDVKVQRVDLSCQLGHPYKLKNKEILVWQ